MAAAEARTAWQRAANRYFVQEDAKRAPKLACCQSSGPSKQSESGPTNASDTADHRAVGFMPSNRTPYSSLPPDAKWWLQMQPNFGHQRGFIAEHLNPKTAGVETPPPATASVDSQVGDIATMSEESLCSVEFEELESFLDVKKKTETESKLEELNVVDSKVDQDFVDLKNMTDYYEFLEMEMVGGSVSKDTGEFSSSTGASWVGGQNVPWWRVTDGGELASFVAQKSLHHIENCDLPPPQKKHIRRETYKMTKSVDHDEILMSSVDWEAQNDVILSPSSGGSQRQHSSSFKEVLSRNENATSKSLRTNIAHTEEEGRSPVSDPTKAKLLEALCHSQTRAREAEKAAKEAYNEKEHLLKLFLKQASQLFAYRQWFKLLQLETLLLQNKDSDSSPFTALPDLLPWTPYDSKRLRKNWMKTGKGKRRKRGSDGNDIGKYAVAFAVGFTLVGAGLILGWTVGWLLPAF